LGVSSKRHHAIHPNSK